jgi:hypothetical protein
MAEELETSVSSCQAKYRALVEALPKWTKSEIHTLKSGYDAGDVWSKISNDLNKPAIQCMVLYAENHGISHLPKCIVENTRPEKAYSKWTTQESQLLLELVDSGKKWKQIASTVQRTKTACQSELWLQRTALHAIGPSQSKKALWRTGRLQSGQGSWTDEDIRKLHQLRGENEKWARISTMMGRTVAACTLKYRQVMARPWERQDEHHLIQLRDRGTSFKEIGGLLTRTEVSCRDKYNRLKAEALD